VVHVAVAVEDHLFDVLLFALLGEQLPDALRRADLALVRLAPALDALGERADGHERRAARVVDDLGVDVLGRAEHRQARALGRAGNLLADAQLAALATYQLGHS
jgi:hypothetical protein